MKVYVQTSLTPQMKVYDTNAPATSEDTGIVKSFRKFLNPVVQVQDDSGGILYKSGDFYEPVVFYVIMGILGVAAGYGLVKLIKKVI